VNPLEIDLLLNYSTAKEQLESLFGGVSGIFDKLKELKIDLASMISTEGFDSINWTPIIGKLFSPANLITFFTAMAAFGITSAIVAANQNEASTNAVTSTTTNPTSSSITANQTATQQVTSVIGTLAGPTSEVSEMIAELEGYGETTQQAITTTTQLGEALKLTGGQFSETFNSAFIQYLQNAGATTSDQIDQVTTSLLQASQASDGLLSMNQIVTDTQAFALAASTAGTGLKGILQSVLDYAAQSKVNFAAAKSNLDTMTTALQGTNSTLNAIVGFPKQLANSLNTDAAGAWTGMETKIESIADNQIPGVTLSMVGFNNTAELGEKKILAQTVAIDKVANSLNGVSGPQGVQLVNTEFDSTLTALDKINVATQTFENEIAKFIGTPLLNLLNAITSFGAWELGSGGAGIAAFVLQMTALSALSFAGLLGILGLLGGAAGTAVASVLAKAGITVAGAGAGAGVEAAGVGILGADGLPIVAGEAAAGATATALVPLILPAVMAGVVAYFAGSALADIVKNKGLALEPGTTTELAPGVNDNWGGTLNINFGNAPAGTTVTKTNVSQNLQMMINGLPGNAGLTSN
jgi:hypothetical protein